MWLLGFLKHFVLLAHDRYDISYFLNPNFGQSHWTIEDRFPEECFSQEPNNNGNENNCLIGGKARYHLFLLQTTELL